MNAGAHGSELADRLVWADVFHLSGEAAGRAARMKPDELGFGYRRSALPAGAVVTAARFALTPAPEATVRAEIDEARRWRRDNQPVNQPNCGSVFANPPEQHDHGGWQQVLHTFPKPIPVRAGQSLAHVFTLLSLVLPTAPLQIAYRGLHTDDPKLRGTALEYLEGVLPAEIRQRLWLFLEDTRTTGKGPARPRDEILADLL